jgi:hypothetical protein
MGLPIEILQGDYPDRLKIFDNYPVEYPKYHFFGSSDLAILLRPVQDIQYADFALARIFVISVFISVIFEGISSLWGTRKSLGALSFALILCATSLAPNTYWAINSTNYFSVGFFILFVVSYITKSRQVSLIWLGLFSISSARSIFPGLVIFAWILYKNRLEIRVGQLVSLTYLRHLRGRIILGLIIFSNWAVMLFTGKSVDNLTLGSILEILSIPYQNFVSKGWLVIMSPPILLDSSTHSIEAGTIPMTEFFPYLIFLALSIFILIIRQEYRKCTFGLLILSVGLGVLLNLGYLQVDKSIQLQYLLFCFLIPSLSIFALTKNTVRRLSVIFIISSLILVVLMPPDFGIPNWALIEWFWAALLIRALISSLHKWNYLTLLPLICISALLLSTSQVNFTQWFQPSVDNSTSHRITPNDLKFITGKECGYGDLHGLLNSISGERTYFYPQKSDRFSATLNFVSDYGDVPIAHC